jgi:hypothetical protein
MIREDMFPSVAGITPEKLFPVKLIYCTGEYIKDDDGMGPEKPLSDRSM